MIKSSFRPRARAIAWILTLVYFASYFMRINFAVMIVKVCSDLNCENSEVAVIITALTIAYGLGQVISGFLGDQFKPQWMLTGGLALAILCNVGMFFAPTIPSMIVIWAINGFAHSMLWPPIVRLLAMYLTDDEYGYAVVRVSWGSSFATIALYLLCPVLLWTLSWRQIILLCAVVGAAILVIWQIFQKRLFDQPLAGAQTKKTANTPSAVQKLPKYVFVAIPLIMLGIVLQGSLRDGVQNWMPSVLCESFGIPENYAILSTVILALFSVVSYMSFDFLHRKLFHNEVTCASVIFVGAAVSSVLLVCSNMWFPFPVASMLLMGIIVACMHGINLMLISVVPKRFVKTGKVSTMSGILNACTYVGASASTYGFAVLAEKQGWNFTFWMWFVISLAGVAVCAGVAPIWRKFRKEYVDVPEIAGEPENLSLEDHKDE